jgi:hypothetical protein
MSAYFTTRANYLRAMSGPSTCDLTTEQLREQAPEGSELWQARTFYANGEVQARTEFFLPAGSSDSEARASVERWWRFARLGEYANPSLRVTNLDAAARELARAA